MPNAENGLLQYEAGQTANAMSALSDSGDHKNYSSGASLWSGRSGYTPVVLPDGLANGGEVSAAASGSNNVVDVSALTAYIQGVLVTVSAQTDETVTRASTDTHVVNSITVTDAGAVAVVPGAEGTAFSEVRGAAGGPPLIPVTSIEIGQVRLSAQTAAAVNAAEILAVDGEHVERFDYPLWNESPVDGGIEFISALPLIHTGSVPKNVYASYADPIFADIQKSSDFVPAENTHSVSSTQIYGGTIGNTSTTLGQGSFTAYLQDGVTDPLVKLKDEVLWFRYYPDRYKTPYHLMQGKLGISRTFPADNSIAASCTVSPESVGVDKAA